MDPTAPVNASILQYLESHGYKDAAQALRKEAKVAKAEEIASSAQKDNGSIRPSPPSAIIILIIRVLIFFASQSNGVVDT
jgi:hypothetical protein